MQGIRSCGCDQRSFELFDRGVIEAHRLNMLELEKPERETLLLSILESCSQRDVTVRGKEQRKVSFFA